MGIKIALAGNPNCGKTTIFNACLLYTSWDFFDYLLDKANVVGTPVSGFGPS